MDNSLNVLASRAGFNTALRHFKIVNRFIGEVADNVNLADAINAALDDGQIRRYQVRAKLNALLIDKRGYAYKTHNLVQTIEDVQPIVDTIRKWTNIQLVVAYYHPQTDLFALNPKSIASWETVLPIVRDELLVVYAGPATEDVSAETLESATADFVRLLDGERIRTKKDYVGPESVVPEETPRPSSEAEYGLEATAQREAPAAPSEVAVAAPPAGTAAPKRRMTPRYSVLVTNELFHNGNVEAWKKIIDSYKTKYDDLDVLIWYENERINDINALFKWGKVKHGTPIMVSVAGDNIRDVSKLQRYLFEGASPRFEAFLHGGVDRTLDLF